MLACEPHPPPQFEIHSTTPALKQNSQLSHFNNIKKCGPQKPMGRFRLFFFCFCFFEGGLGSLVCIFGLILHQSLQLDLLRSKKKNIVLDFPKFVLCFHNLSFTEIIAFPGGHLFFFVCCWRNKLLFILFIITCDLGVTLPLFWPDLSFTFCTSSFTAVNKNDQYKQTTFSKFYCRKLQTTQVLEIIFYYPQDICPVKSFGRPFCKFDQT